MTEEITYIDDFEYLPEAAYVDDNESYKELQREKEKKEAELLNERGSDVGGALRPHHGEVNENTTIHAQSILATGTKESKTPRPCQVWESPQYRPLEKQKMKPWKGPLTHPPDKIVFATWCDYLSYKEAWKVRQEIQSRPSSSHRLTDPLS